jgi:hypothetical protein
MFAVNDHRMYGATLLAIARNSMSDQGSCPNAATHLDGGNGTPRLAPETA